MVLPLLCVRARARVFVWFVCVYTNDIGSRELFLVSASDRRDAKTSHISNDVAYTYTEPMKVVLVQSVYTLRLYRHTL